MLSKDNYHYGAVEAVARHAFANCGMPYAAALAQSGYSKTPAWEDLSYGGRDLVRQEVSAIIRAIDTEQVVGNE